MGEENFSLYAKLKKDRQKQLLKYIAEAKNAEVEHIIGRFSFEWGLRASTIRRYLDELELAGFIEITPETPIEPSSVKITDEGRKILGGG